MANFGRLPAFHGNPYVTITAIDVSGGIACSRSGTIQTPAFVHVSASAVTATGTSKPYNDLEYTWDFGDPSGVEIFDDPFGIARNMNTAQRGPEAAYVYRLAGTHIVTLTVRGKNGGSYVTATKTLDITVQAFNASGGTFYFDLSTTGAESGAGTQLSPYISSATLQTKLGVANTKLLLKRGSSFSRNARFEVNASPIRIDAYGSGANPILVIHDSVDAGTQKCVIILRNGSSGAQPKNDVVYSSIDFKRTGTTSENILFFSALNDHTAPGSHTNIYVDNCNIISDGAGVNGMACQLDATVGSGATITGFGIWGGSCAPGLNDTAQGTSFYGGAQNWTFILGWDVSGSGGDATRDHHIYPDVQNHALFRYINFGSGPTRNYCINSNWDDDPNQSANGGGLTTARYWLISDCDMTGVLRAFDAGSRNNHVAETKFTGFVAQFNAIHELTGDGVILFSCCTEMTVRYNRCWLNDGGRFWAPQAGELKTVLDGNVYGNYIYSTGGAASGGIFDYQTSGWTKAQLIKENIVYDTQVTSKIWNAIFSDQVTAVSVIDANQYWFPNDANSKPFYNSGAEKTFAELQASTFEANGSVADPDWVNPSVGDFRQRSVSMTLTCV